MAFINPPEHFDLGAEDGQFSFNVTKDGAKCLIRRDLLAIKALAEEFFMIYNNADMSPEEVYEMQFDADTRDERRMELINAARQLASEVDILWNLVDTEK